MKISLKFVSKFLNERYSNKKLIELIEKYGIEVNEIIDFAGHISDSVIFVEVQQVKPIENTKLKLATVFDGTHVYNVVCGAPNCKAHNIAVFAKTGTILNYKNTTIEIKKKTIHGHESNGMLCSEQELGIGDNGSEIISIDSSTTLFFNNIKDIYDLIGRSISHIIGDVILDISLTPDMIHCSSAVGLSEFICAIDNTANGKISLKNDSITPKYNNNYLNNSNFIAELFRYETCNYEINEIPFNEFFLRTFCYSVNIPKTIDAIICNITGVILDENNDTNNILIRIKNLNINKEKYTNHVLNENEYEQYINKFLYISPNNYVINYALCLYASITKSYKLFILDKKIHKKENCLIKKEINLERIYKIFENKVKKQDINKFLKRKFKIKDNEIYYHQCFNNNLIEDSESIISLIYKSLCHTVQSRTLKSIDNIFSTSCYLNKNIKIYNSIMELLISCGAQQITSSPIIHTQENKISRYLNKLTSIKIINKHDNELRQNILSTILYCLHLNRDLINSHYKSSPLMLFEMGKCFSEENLQTMKLCVLFITSDNMENSHGISKIKNILTSIFKIFNLDTFISNNILDIDQQSEFHYGINGKIFYKNLEIGSIGKISCDILSKININASIFSTEVDLGKICNHMHFQNDYLNDQHLRILNYKFFDITVPISVKLDHLTTNDIKTQIMNITNDVSKINPIDIRSIDLISVFIKNEHIIHKTFRITFVQNQNTEISLNQISYENEIEKYFIKKNTLNNKTSCTL